MIPSIPQPTLPPTHTMSDLPLKELSAASLALSGAASKARRAAASAHAEVAAAAGRE